MEIHWNVSKNKKNRLVVFVMLWAKESSHSGPLKYSQIRRKKRMYVCKDIA